MKIKKILLVGATLVVIIGITAGILFRKYGELSQSLVEPKQTTSVPRQPVQAEKLTNEKDGYSGNGTSQRLIKTNNDEITKSNSTDSSEKYECDEYRTENVLYPKDKAALVLELNVSEKEIKLLSDPKLSYNGHPNFFPGSFAYIVQLVSSDDYILAEYGIPEQRRVWGEIGYEGPSTLDQTDTIFIVPYFKDTKKVKISYCHKTMLSIDLAPFL